MGLLSPLQIAGAQMNIEDVHNLSRRHLQIAADTPATLPARSRQLVDLDLLDRQPAQHDVAVGRAAQLARFADTKLEANGIGQVLRLVLLPARAAEANYFL